MSTSKSGIEWTDRTWNPTRGCRRISPGCENCYAERQAARFCGKGQPYEGLVRLPSTRNGQSGPRWTGEARLIEKTLREPLTWRKPARVFVDSMSDLFYEGFDDEQIARVFAVMALAHWHTLQVLTKRAGRMAAWFAVPQREDQIRHQAAVLEGQVFGKLKGRPAWTWPLPNVWLGASVEDQQRAEERLPHLLATPAAVRFASYEPALGPVDFGPWLPRWRRTCDRADVTDVRVPGIGVRPGNEPAPAPPAPPAPPAAPPPEPPAPPAAPLPVAVTPKKQPRKVSTTIYIRPDQEENLKALSERTKVPLSEYVRQGIDEVLALKREPNDDSAAP